MKAVSIVITHGAQNRTGDTYTDSKTKDQTGCRQAVYCFFLHIISLFYSWILRLQSFDFGERLLITPDCLYFECQRNKNILGTRSAMVDKWNWVEVHTLSLTLFWFSTRTWLRIRILVIPSSRCDYLCPQHVHIMFLALELKI